MSGFYEDDIYADNDPVRAAYEADPAGFTVAAAAAAAQQAVEASRQQTAYDNGAVVSSQAALTAEAVDRQMEEKYGAEWTDHRADVFEVFQRNPHLVPADGSALDPNTLRQSMEDGLVIARNLKADDYADKRWQEIQRAGTGKLGL